MQTTLAGRSGIVTDAISAVGRAIALELAREGARLALGYRGYRGTDFEAVEQLVRDLVRVGGEAVPMRLPVDNVGELEHVIGSLVGLWGWVDFVVDMSRECAVSRAALPWLLERGRGRIVLITPSSADNVHFTRTDLRALAARGVTINTIHVDRLPSDQPLALESEGCAESASASGSPAPHVPRAAPQDVAASTEFLLAQDCCVTGQVLDLGAERHPLSGGSRRAAAYTLHHNACASGAALHLPPLARGAY